MVPARLLGLLLQLPPDLVGGAGGAAGLAPALGLLLPGGQQLAQAFQVTALDNQND